MNGTLRLSTGLMACCDDEGCEVSASVVVGARHLCVAHAREEYAFYRAVAHLGLRPMSREEEQARKEGKGL
jgi:catechol-2,3-dioxygenase